MNNMNRLNVEIVRRNSSDSQKLKTRVIDSLEKEKILKFYRQFDGPKRRKSGKFLENSSLGNYSPFETSFKGSDKDAEERRKRKMKGESRGSVVSSRLGVAMENSYEKNAVEVDDRHIDDDGYHGEFREIITRPTTEILSNAFKENEKPKNFVIRFQSNVPDVNILGKGTKRIFGGNSPIIVGDFPKESVIIKFPSKPERPFEPERNFDHRILNFFDEPWNLYESSRQAVYNEVFPIKEYVASDDVPLEKVSPTRMVNIEGQNEREQGQNIRSEHLYDEATVRNDVIRTRKRTLTSQKISRSRRDATSVLLKSEEGDEINITVEEPQDPEGQRVKIGDGDLVLRKGGIAIAGPGGAATAYTGGTAIVGPYGTVYKSPEGTAILGPFGKIVNITDDTDFEEIIKMHREMEKERRLPPLAIRSNPPFNGFRSFKNVFSYITNRPIKVSVTSQRNNFAKSGPSILRLKDTDLRRRIENALNLEFDRVVQDAPVDEVQASQNETSLIFRPKSKAEAGRRGVAVSAPVSHAILFPGQKARIVFEPEAVASAGPAGFAHAHSDLFVSYVTKNGTRKYDALDAISSLNFARGKSFNSVLPPMPPLSTIIRPPHQGQSDKKKKPKPAKPAKEEAKEGNSEEVGEEQGEESSSEVPQTQENSNESVGVSPPPDGASVAEAKPIGLAIAGPGGVAAAKPQGTAVVGPGGLAIARPVGTAIAGVEVEGSVPIGGQHKHKKKPKQDEEKPEGELHYVGGLTGPIGHPQPTRKQFENSANFKSIIGGENDGSDMEEKLFFQGRQNNHGFQLKLGQKDGKYGFVPMLSSPLVQEGREFGQRVEAPSYFHGPSGTGENVENVFGNHAFRRA